MCRVVRTNVCVARPLAGGGVSKMTLMLVLVFLSVGELANLQKVLFMQQLVSGLPDSGPSQMCVLLLFNEVICNG
jgi:hypothetical protein